MVKRRKPRRGIAVRVKGYYYLRKGKRIAVKGYLREKPEK